MYYLFAVSSCFSFICSPPPPPSPTTILYALALVGKTDELCCHPLLSGWLAVAPQKGTA